MLQTATNRYVLPMTGGGRLAPHHGYSINSITHKRLRENTSALAVTMGCLLPMLNDVNKQLDKHVDAGTDVSLEELLHIFSNSGKHAAVLYADRCARIACQTGLACVLIQSKAAYGNTAVYLWDLYPRLHQRYIGAVLSALRVPIFVSNMLGPKPTPQDAAFLEAPSTGLCAFEDSLRRDAITLMGDVIVDSVRIAIRKDVEQPAAVMARQAVLRVTVTVVGAVGAGVGRAVAGEKGEYWGNIFGVLSGPAVAVQLSGTMQKLRVLRSRRPSRAPSSSAAAEDAKARRRRHPSADAARPSGVPAAAAA